MRIEYYLPMSSTKRNVPSSPGEAITEPGIVQRHGRVVGEITVTIGPRFLELFSEHLYSSPNKAFEELVSNSWDAGANAVYIGVPSDRSGPNATVWILDDGVSMDFEGFAALWAVAESAKRREPQSHRPQIGKFGIGKLATYILANELTYVCRAADGCIRSITMDYRWIDGAAKELHIDPVRLSVRELTPQDLTDLLAKLSDGGRIASIIAEGVPRAAGDEVLDEFGGVDPEPAAPGGTWTLAILTSMKEAGRDMQIGHIRRMLSAALPLGNTLTIDFNGDALRSKKLDVPVAERWQVGPELGIESLTAGEGDKMRQVSVRNVGGAEAAVHIEGIEGPITGTAQLFDGRISGGKSEEVAASNGFFVNVRGRVLNVGDPYFGLANLNHAAWAKFRAAVRVDGLDDHLAVNREDLLEGPALEAFREFLRAIFNKARSAHDAASRAAWPSAGEVLADTWGTVPLEALRAVISEGLASAAGPPSFVDLTGVDDLESERRQWDAEAAERAGAFIAEVAFNDSPSDERLVKYELKSRRVLVNRNHPFAREHAESHEQQILLRDAALVELLTQAYMASLGIHGDVIGQIAEYRDQSLRLVAQIRRRTGLQIAEMLAQATSHDKGLERIVGDALEYIGFDVVRHGGSGEPEGVAIAPATPGESGLIKKYSFTYDAKSTGGRRVKTANVNISGLVRHRKKHVADHVLVVASEYEEGALEKECLESGITPMRAADLGRLLILVATTGHFDLLRFREVFKLHDPAAVGEWVKAFESEIRSGRRLTLGVILDALSKVGFRGPDAVTVSVIAREARAVMGLDDFPTAKDVSYVLHGLSVLVPSLVRLGGGGEVYLGADADRLRREIVSQLRRLPSELGAGDLAGLLGAGG